MVPAPVWRPKKFSSRNSAMRKSDASGWMVRTLSKRLTRSLWLATALVGIGLVMAAGPVRAADDAIVPLLLLAGFIPLKSQCQEQNRNGNKHNKSKFGSHWACLNISLPRAVFS